MESEKEIKLLLNLISQLNHRQWEMIKTVVDIAFQEKIKNEKVSFEKVEELICEDLISNGIEKR